VDSVGVEIDTITLNYLPSKIIAQIPFEKFDGSEREFFIADYCGNQHFTYTTYFVEGGLFCEADTCWGGADTNGPPEHEFIKYVAGVGMYKKQNYVVGPDGYSKTTKMVYYNIGGEICGTEVVVGIDQTIAAGKQIVLHPNPASKTVYVVSSVTISQLEMFDATGNKVFHGHPAGNEIAIDLRQLNGGLYFVRVLLKNGDVVIKKLVVLNN
jgi:hypothetical protein